MKSNKYTLDRFENNIAVFLKYPNETESLLIDRQELNETFQEGDIVRILVFDHTYKIERLEDETTTQKHSIQQLLDQLKNEKK